MTEAGVGTFRHVPTRGDRGPTRRGEKWKSMRTYRRSYRARCLSSDRLRSWLPGFRRQRRRGCPSFSRCSGVRRLRPSRNTYHPNRRPDRSTVGRRGRRVTRVATTGIVGTARRRTTTRRRGPTSGCTRGAGTVGGSSWAPWISRDHPVSGG